MLVTFTTKAYANITMFGDVANAMLRMMGHSETVPGAILAEDVPVALGRLKAAVAAEKTQAKDDEAVSIAHRAMPLIDLLTAAARDECNVMWDRATFLS